MASAEVAPPEHLTMLSRTVESVLKSEPAATAKHLRALLGLRAGVRLASVLRARGGLPHTAATLQAAARLRVCYVGGSITEQKAGWRPRTHEFLSTRFPCDLLGHTAVSASMGNVGSKVLSFLVDDWVNAHEPDLVFLEAVVNDGDSVLETGDEVGVRRAVEGIVRQIRARHPRCDIVLVHMLLRGDLPPSRRTGTRAWVDNDVPGAAAVYQQRVPALLDTVAEHYGLPSISLIPALAPLPSQALDVIFRDDCHHSIAGAAFVASIVAEALERCIVAQGTTGFQADRPPAQLLPPVMDAAHWTGGQALAIDASAIRFAHGRQPHHTKVDRDPVGGGQLQWWLLDPHDEVTVHFDGIGLGLLTHVGPDSGLVRCELTRTDVAEAAPRTVAMPMYDQWCYYYRLSVVMLFEGLPRGSYTARIWLDELLPTRQFTRRPAPPGIQGPLKLWLSYSLVMRGTWADQSKPLASAAAHEPTLCATLGEERQAVSVVAPLKHEDDLIRRQQGLPGVAFRLEDDAAASSGVSASWAGDGHEMSQRCAGCGTVAAQLGLLRCSRCKVTFYCGPECQREHWASHKLQCRSA